MTASSTGTSSKAEEPPTSLDTQESINGKQFTDRFGKGGEVMFDRICRKNGIKHRLTDPFSPNQNGKVERFHGTLRPDFLDVVEPFESLAEAQAAVEEVSTLLCKQSLRRG